jgi:hypothetical protein
VQRGLSEERNTFKDELVEDFSIADHVRNVDDKSDFSAISLMLVSSFHHSRLILQLVVNAKSKFSHKSKLLKLSSRK